MHNHALFSVAVTFITLLTELSLFTKPVTYFEIQVSSEKQSIRDEFK